MFRIAVCLLVCALARPAFAQFPPITNRDFSIDLYDGVAIGDTSLIGMGGAGAAHLIGTAGALVNPSALAVRATTDNGSWGFTYHLDWLSGRYSDDYDNNGQVAEGGAAMATTGLGLRINDWAFAATATGQVMTIPGSSLEFGAARVRALVSRWLPESDISVGGGLQFAIFSVAEANRNDDELFEMSGYGLVLGATWVPREQSYRIAAAIDSPIAGGKVEANNCDPLDCMGYILPERVRVPWRFTSGLAYRIAGSAWNQRVEETWRDERSLTLAADLVVTGATSDGYGLEAFGRQQLQRSGDEIIVGLRGGLEFEWVPGRLRVRAGAYWEPPRFDEAAGRTHLTLGADLRVFEFWLFGPRRGRISLTGDSAPRYRNAGISIGFWH